MDSTHIAPSGSYLPLFLRRKWKEENEASAGGPSRLLSMSEQYPQITRAEKTHVVSRIFNAKEIEDRMQRISETALIDIQKQIQRGEESYYEETNGHGNLFRGWDAFVDSRDAVGSIGLSSMPQGGSRRIPADCRWFASSCQSISRPSRPPSSLLNRLQSADPPMVTSSTALPTAATSAAGTPSTAKSSVTEPEVAISSHVSSTQILDDIMQTDSSSQEKPETVASGDHKVSSCTKTEADTKNKDESAPESGRKRKRPEEDEGETSVGPDPKKQASDDAEHVKKSSVANKQETIEEITVPPRTPVAARQEEKIPRRVDSQKRRSSRRKAG